jgi:hypothetical protein
VVEGTRVVRYTETFPTGTRFVELVEDDHVHFIFGTDEQLAGLGLIEEADVVEDSGEVVETPKSRKNPPRRKKSDA